MPEKSGPPPPNETITVSSGSHTTPPDLRFLHYNDVYHVESSSAEPVGGAARFQTLVDHYRSGDDFSSHPELLTFFSGDAFNPSIESAVTKGSHMVPILNNIGTDVAALGNHDLDFGVTQFNRLAAKCKFPWLIANVLDPALGDDVPIGGIPKTLMLTASNGIKVGVIGLGEREWLSTINSLPPDIIYKSASATAKELVPKLRAEGAEIIVAVTHMREPNDNKLAENTDGIIDIILGGHDHYYNHSLIKGTHVLRSGTDFKQLSYIEARRSTEKPGRWDFDIIRRDITSEIPAHEETAQLIDKHTAALKTKLNKIIGYTAAPLDARFRTVRLRESNISNWVCDIMRHYYGGDCALMASGTVRGDQIYPPGPILLKDIMNCFPFEDPVVVIMASGQQIWDALENGVSQYPALEGRFPQVSNINFEFDATKPPGSRIVSASMGGIPFDMGKQYKLVTRGYMGRGKDGYDSLLIEAEGGTTREIVSEENGILISMMLRQYFMSLRVMGQWKYWGKHIGGYWNNVSEKVGGTHLSSAAQSPVETRTTNLSTNLLSRNDWSAQKIRERKAQGQPADDSDSGEDDDAANENERIDREMAIVRRVAKKWTQRAGIKCSLVDELHDEEIEVDWTRAIAPHVEGRIVCVAGEHAS